jgi:hypothetical protein
MRTVLILLLLANLTLFAYTRLDSVGGGEGVRLTQQVQPDKIKLLTPREVAALGPSKVAALADVCAEWGPFPDADRTRALAELAPFGLGTLFTQRRVDVAGAFGVQLPPFTSKGGADRRAAELKAQNVADVSVIDIGRGQFAVSLGGYRTEEAASARAATLNATGVPGARVVPRQQQLTQTLFVVRDPQAPLVAKLKDLQAAFPGAELRIGACERA